MFVELNFSKNQKTVLLSLIFPSSHFSLECLIKKPNFHSKNPSCIDLNLIKKNNFLKILIWLEIGISDHHSFIITVLKSQLVKGNAETKLYRDYSEFNMHDFKAELDDRLKSGIVTEYSNFP